VITAGAGATGDGAGTAVRCWDATNNALTVEYNGHSEAVAALLPLSAGSHVASCDVGGRVHVWATATGERLVEFSHGEW
jgi:WD40 repeat protein